MLANKSYFPPPKTNASCQYCQDLNLSYPGIDGMLGIPLKHMQTSAASGCPFCELLTKALELPGLDPPENQELVGVTLFSAIDPKTSAPLPLTARLQTETRHFAEIELFTESVSSCCPSSIGAGRIIDTNAASKNCVFLMESWIDECVSHHDRCRASDPNLLPDRYLDITPGQDPRLVVNHKGDQGKYVALSHCWGGQVSLQLRQKELQNWQQGIPFHDFPKTFQHAIEVCRCLQIPYLWIDSLCIIQDSKEDWAIQGSKMDAVYSNCHIAIAADGARDSKEGFLCNERRKIPTLRLRLQQKKGNGPQHYDTQPMEEVEICARKKGAGNMDIFMHHSWSAEYRSRLSTRGWILQESVLAPRVLHFTAEEITWECRTVSQCECQVAVHNFAYETPIKLQLPPNLDHTEHWGRLVQEFTCRDLSYPSDRLPALSGLASHMKSVNSSVQFYAGIWSDSFAQSLLWFCLDRNPELSPTKRASKRIRPLSAPTWSWASVTGRVILPTGTKQSSTLEELQIACPPSSPNLYGSVSSASITAAASVLRGVLVGNPDRQGVFQVQIRYINGSGPAFLKPDGEIFPDVIGDDMEIIVGEEVVLLDPVGERNTNYVVLRLVDPRAATYERVGIYMTQSMPEDDRGKQLTERLKMTII
ncbi:hypothetical protein PT974_06959 [Cladobotryum mycophilum]|uniref:Heterokaryon incompatibility domain-containing protein n=1 Tax=Cladobotryum mycophilum TaxID=491253 RepID=A0ABR0SNP1_9HYPO